jgi:hypothetical protein
MVDIVHHTGKTEGKGKGKGRVVRVRNMRRDMVPSLGNLVSLTL